MRISRINKLIAQQRFAPPVVVFCIIILMPDVAMSASAIDTKVEKILRSMSTYMGKLSKFSVEADVDKEIIDFEGQKLQLSGEQTAIVSRPDKFRVYGRGAYAEVEFIFDGKTVTIDGKKKNTYVQVNAPGKIEGAFQTVRIETGLDAPGADLYIADTYSGLVTDITSSSYIGTVYVNGIECHHLALRAQHVDSQIWIATGKKPLPMKYIITSKWVTGSPQFAIRFRNWNTEPKINANTFKFVATKGAKKIDAVPVNEIGEMIEGIK